MIENYNANKYHINPGIYVYNYPSDNNTVYRAWYNEIGYDVKPLAIYYIKGP